METIKDLGPLQFIRGEKGGRYPFCNSVYIPEAGVLIDPASNRDVLTKIRDRIQSVWLSHWHEDHLMHLDLFSDIPLSIHKLDETPLQDIDTFVSWYGFNMEGNNELVDHWKHLLTDLFHFQPRSASSYLADGDVIDLGSVTVNVIHAPGHSPGNVSFFFQEPEILFLGDNDLTKFGPWYGDRYSDIDQIIETIGKLRKIPARLWLTGHEEGIFENVTATIWDDYLAVIDHREEKLYDLLREPKTLDDIGRAWIIYGKPKQPIADFEMMERVSMRKHAERLITRGLVALTDGRYHRTD